MREISFVEILEIVFHHRILFVILGIIGVSAALADHVLFPSYRATALLYTQPIQNNPLQEVATRLTGSTLQSDVTKDDVPEKYFQELRSFEFAMELAKELKASQEFAAMNKDIFIEKSLLHRWRVWVRHLFIPSAYLADLSDEQIAKRLSGWYEATRDSPGSIRISVTTPDMRLSLFLANFIAHAASKYISTQEMRELDDAKNYVLSQLGDTQKTIQDIDQEIVLYKKTNKVATSASAPDDRSSRETEIKKKLDETELNYDQNTKWIVSLEQEVVKQTQDNAKLVGHPVIGAHLGLPQKIEELKRQNQYLSMQRESLSHLLRQIEGSVDPYFEQRTFDLQKKIELQYLLYEELKKQVFQIEMQRIVVGDLIRSIEKARDFQIHRSVSLSMKILLAVTIAWLLGGLGIYGWDLVMPTVRGREDLEDHGFAYLGSIPDLSFSSLRTHPSVAVKKISNQIARMLQNKQGPKRILIASVSHGEGRSFLARQLALILKNAGFKVLITPTFQEITPETPDGTPDYVLIDPQPLLHTPDISFADQEVDLAILVTAFGKTRLSQLDYAAHLLMDVKSQKPILAVLNKKFQSHSPARLADRKSTLGLVQTQSTSMNDRFSAPKT